MKACYNCEPHHWNRIYGPSAHKELERILDFGDEYYPVHGNRKEFLDSLNDAEVMLTTWGAYAVDEEVLERCPNLKLIVHGAGSVKFIMTQGVIDRRILVSSGVAVNARPVAEFCLGIILSALKDVFRYPFRFRESYHKEDWDEVRNDYKLGYYQSKVGLIGYGTISRALLELLKGFDFDVYVSSGYFGDDDEAFYKVKQADTDWIFTNCDVVSLHCADIPRNYNIVNSERLGMMKEGACLLNTSRGRMVDEKALVRALETRDLVAILDVTHPEPPEPDNPLLKMKNCFILPHISGSIGREVERLGAFVYEEIKRYQAGEELKGLVNISNLESIA